LIALSDEKAWSENFGPFLFGGRENDRLARKVGDTRKPAVVIVFIEALEKSLEFRALNLKHFWLDLEVVRQDIWSGNMFIATAIQM